MTQFKAYFSICSAAFAAAAIVMSLVLALLQPGESSSWLLILWGTQAFALVCAGVGMRLYRRHAAVPLDVLSHQATEFGMGRFNERAQPQVGDFHALSKAMNVAAGRLRMLLQERETRLAQLREHIEVDPVTKLGSAVFFESELAAQLQDVDARHGGGVVVIRVDDLAGLNRRLGRERADDLLRAVAALLRVRLGVLGTGAFAARLNGADFAVLAPGATNAFLVQWLNQLAHALDGLRAEMFTDRPQTAWVGATTYAGTDDVPQVMSRAESMVLACERVRAPWKITTALHPLHSLNTGEWRALIETALDTGRVTLQLYDVLDREGLLVHQEAMVRMQLLDGRVLSGEDIVPPATRTGRTVDIDLRVVGLALAAIETSGQPIAANVSLHSVGRPTFRSRLAALLEKAGAHAEKLSLEVEESILVDGLQDLAQLAAVAKPYGTHLGIDNLRSHCSAIVGLGALGVTYVKLDGSTVRTVDSSPAARVFAEMCIAVCRAEQLLVLATGIHDAQDLRKVNDLAIDGCTGRAIRRQAS